MAGALSAEEQKAINEQLLDAAQTGELDAPQDAIARGANLEATRDSSNIPALHLAAIWNRANAVKILLEAGAEVDKGCDSLTALHTAASNNHKETVTVLLAAGADLAIKSRWHETPIEYARRWGRYTLAKDLQFIIDDPSQRPKPEDVGLDMTKRNAALRKLGLPAGEMTYVEKVEAETARRNIEEQGRGF